MYRIATKGGSLCPRVGMLYAIIMADPTKGIWMRSSLKLGGSTTSELAQSRRPFWQSSTALAVVTGAYCLSRIESPFNFVFSALTYTLSLHRRAKFYLYIHVIFREFITECQLFIKWLHIGPSSAKNRKGLHCLKKKSRVIYTSQLWRIK